MADLRPAYVQQLDRERKVLKAELDALQDGLTDLRRYLQSDKFAHDRSVNVQDVLLRMDEAESAGRDAAAAA